MRILIENENFKYQGGSETISLNTYNILKKQGHDVFFYATKSEIYYEKNYEYAKYFPQSSCSIKSYLKNPIAYYWNFEAEKNLKDMIKDVKPDIVHLNLLISPSILKACKDMKIPTVMTLHVPSPICPANTFFFRNKKLCTDFKCKNGNYLYCVLNGCKSKSLEPNIRKALLSYIFKITNAYSAIDYMVCPSNIVKEYVLKSNIGINKERVITINNFLTNEELKTTPNYENRGYFLYSGRLVREKGIHYLFEALKSLPKDIKLHILGTGAQESFLKNFVKENNLNNVEFKGFLSGEELKNEYQNCIALIVPSNWFETFGMINIEAFINGKPVIASNIGGIPEIVEHNKTGLLFEPANIEQLKNCILEYWNNPQKVIEHGKNAYEKALTKYNETTYYNNLIKVYEEAINVKR